MPEIRTAYVSDAERRADLLDKAADHIQTHGLTTEEYVKDAANPRACPVCPRSAIAIAVGRHPLFAAAWPELCDHYEEDADDAGHLSIEGQAELQDLRLIHDTERMLVDYLRSEGVNVADLPLWESGTVIERWADDPSRTLPQILGAMRAAAERGRTNA